MSSGRQAKGNDLEAIRLEAARALCKAVEAEIGVEICHIYIYLYMHVHTDTHTHIYIYEHIYIYVCVYAQTIIQNYENERMRNSAVTSRRTIPEKKQKLRVESGVVSIFFFWEMPGKPRYDRGLWKKQLPTERLEIHMTEWWSGVYSGETLAYLIHNYHLRPYTPRAGLEMIGRCRAPSKLLWPKPGARLGRGVWKVSGDYDEHVVWNVVT